MREKLREDVKTAMKAKDARRLGTLRLMLAAIQERDNASPTGKIADTDIPPVIAKMLRQRKESIETYEKAGREDLAQIERDEIAIIEEYQPKQMGEADARAAIEKTVAELGASGMKDMGRVMSALKERYGAQMDMGRANGVVKELLAPK